MSLTKKERNPLLSSLYAKKGTRVGIIPLRLRGRGKKAHDSMPRRTARGEREGGSRRVGGSSTHCSPLRNGGGEKEASSSFNSQIWRGEGKGNNWVGSEVVEIRSGLAKGREEKDVLRQNSTLSWTNLRGSQWHVAVVSHLTRGRGGKKRFCSFLFRREKREKGRDGREGGSSPPIIQRERKEERAALSCATKKSSSSQGGGKEGTALAVWG